MIKRLLPFLLVLVILAAGLAWTNASVHAQGCTDATGRPIPCPGQDKKTPTPIPPTATFTPPPTSTALPTETALPLANPTFGPETEGSSWTGSCSLKDLKCPLVFSNACTHVKGTVEVESTTDTTVTLKCTVPLLIEPTPLPIAVPTEEPAEAKVAFCVKGDKDAKVACMLDLASQCMKAGGTATSGFDPIDGNGEVFCSEDVFIVTEPTPLPLAVPDGDHIGTCNANDDNFQECMDQMERQCTDGTLVVKVDLYSGNGTSYDYYCIPHKPTFPPGGWLPWIAGIGGLGMGLLLPAVQKVREAASRSKMPNNKNPELMRNNPDGDSTAGKPGSGKPTPPPPPPPPSGPYLPQSKEHVLLSNQPAEPPASGAIRTVAAAQTDYNEPPANEDGMQLRAKRAEVDPRADDSETRSGSSTPQAR